MEIALVFPGITDCGFNSRHGIEGTWIHHGLGILASALKRSGHRVRLIDLRRLKGWDHFQRIVETMESEVFGITLMSVDFDPGIRAAHLIKETRPESIIVVGGPHPSICPEEFEPLATIDHIVKGEGEITLPDLLDDLEKNRNVPRIVQGRRLENLDEAPWVDRDLFQRPEQPFVPFLPAPFVTLLAGRGCRYNCNFCQPSERILFGKKVRRRSVKNVVDELEFLHRTHRFESFMIHDDCLTEDADWVDEFCRQLERRRLKRPFVCQSRADIVCRKPETIAAMKKVGLELIVVGFESGSDRMLRFLRKGCTRQQNLEAADICRRLGIKIWANYMLGLPTETREEALETFSMIKEIRPYHCSPAFYTPHPGSDLFDMGKKQGLHLFSDHHDYYRRNSFEPKIKGPDYEFLRQTLDSSFHRHLGQNMNTPLRRTSRKIRARIKNLIDK
ncbi:MAG: B12-binding domain-containing radical SAM protein [Proteobacteria bacterium]|nr:B12-binding domain-containing radical SAM protein [Pseudomonadota bacterium]